MSASSGSNSYAESGEVFSFLARIGICGVSLETGISSGKSGDIRVRSGSSSGEQVTSLFPLGKPAAGLQEILQSFPANQEHRLVVL